MLGLELGELGELGYVLEPAEKVGPRLGRRLRPVDFDPLGYCKVA